MITGSIITPAGDIPKVSTKLAWRDHLGTIAVRWSINRNNYKVTPGLYAVGNPTDQSDVFVTANYKLSFDHVRKNLDGINAWILVLDTKGVNVWCAAGKGTFSTKELVYRIKVTSLDRIVSHRKLIVPQLGATGISAHEVKQQTSITEPSVVKPQAVNFTSLGANSFNAAEFRKNPGFNVVYGPIKASDIKPFLNNNYKATKEMRKVTFTFTDRIKLIPVDFVYGKYKLLIAFALLFFLSGINKSGISFQQAINIGLQSIFNIFLAYVTGVVITPMLLPYIPARSFALKGFIMGIITSVVLLLLNKLGTNYFEILSWFLIISGISSFVAMNFTGSSTFTSLSGVKKEMKIAIPLQIAFSVIGLILFVTGKLI
jgi:hypothetical protein